MSITDTNLIEQICNSFLSTQPYYATLLFHTHLNQVSLPYSPLDPNHVLLKQLKKYPRSLLRNTLEEIIVQDTLLSKQMKPFPLYSRFIKNPLSYLIDFVNKGKQPINSIQDFKLFLERFYGTVDIIRQINLTLLESAKKGYVMSSKQVNIIVSNAVNATFDESLFKIQPKLKEFYLSLYLPFAKEWNKWIENYYIPLCKSSLGLFEVPSNKTIYSACIRYHTGHSFSPDEIFTLGIKSVLALREKQKQLIQSHYPGLSVEEFVLKHVKNPSNQFHSPEELKQTVQHLLQLFDSQVRREFDLPNNYKTPILTTVSELNNDISWAFSQQFFLNINEWKNILKSDMVPIILHEAIPGHAFQLQFNHTSEYLTKISLFTNVIEGIGLYAEECFEPTDLLSNYSRLNCHMLRAIRLVIDSGIHYKGWDLDKCLNIMTFYCYNDPNILKTEILRYANMPGHACAYYVGYLDLKRMELRWKQKHPEAIGQKYAFFNELLKYSKYSMTSIAEALGVNI
jgi:uncharacterized protein (DUF885 family)